ncbi:MAG: hypothetical protein J6W52_02585 [Bacteroidaceae bacterium]|nr:hypothetical protein [Bacteroidaceae bacterium]
MIVFIVLSSSVYAQSSREKIVLECGCEITKYKFKCGLCGGGLSVDYESRNRYKDSKLWDYYCPKDTNHKHLGMSDSIDYIHKCKVERCVEQSKKTIEGNNIQLTLTNVCKLKHKFNLLFDDGEKTTKLGTFENGNSRIFRVTNSENWIIKIAPANNENDKLRDE